MFQSRGICALSCCCISFLRSWGATLSWDLFQAKVNLFLSNKAMWVCSPTTVGCVWASFPSGLGVSGCCCPPGEQSTLCSLQYEDRHAKWDTNQAGFSHSHQHGFGLLNAWRLVNAAKVIPCPPSPALWAGRAAQPMAGTSPVLVTPWGDSAAVQDRHFGHHPAGPGSEAAFGMRS